MRSDEAGDGHAVAEDRDRRDALDAEAVAELGVGLDVDLGQLDTPLALGGLGLDDRAERPARAAPGGPEVDDDGDLVGALDDVALEGLACHVHGRSFRSYVVQLPTSAWSAR